MMGIDWTGLGICLLRINVLSSVFGKFDKIRFLVLYASGKETDKE